VLGSARRPRAAIALLPDGSAFVLLPEVSLALLVAEEPNRDIALRERAFLAVLFP